MAVARRKYLADAFNEMLPQLEKTFAAEGKGAEIVPFLQHLIVAEADEETLERINEDLKRELAGMGQGAS